MQVKTFSGANNKEVMDKIKSSLGPDAVILETRSSTAGGVKIVTMTAALERDELAPETTPTGRGAAAGGIREQAGTHFPQFFLDDWNNVKRHLFALMKPALNLDKLAANQRTALEYLQREGASDQVLLELYRRLVKAPSEPVLGPLSKMLPVKPWGREHWPQRLHLIAGPYGAGKTTTAVRMALEFEKNRAARFSRRRPVPDSDEFSQAEAGPGNGRVCIVNADSERGNGRLLLRHYAGLSDFAYREAGNAMEMRGVLDEVAAQGFDLVLIDLPGLRNGEYLRDVADNLGLLGQNSIRAALHLVLPPSYNDAFTMNLLERYHLDLPGSLIWSKLDEFGSYGSMINVALASGLPVSCLSFGPGLLNTLAPATQVMLWRLIFKHELPANNSPAGAEQHPAGHLGDKHYE